MCCADGARVEDLMTRTHSIRTIGISENGLSITGEILLNLTWFKNALTPSNSHWLMLRGHCDIPCVQIVINYLGYKVIVWKYTDKVRHSSIFLSLVIT